MVEEGRDTLKQKFTNGKHLSANDFAVLIDSTLNKRDDKFRGVWKSYIQYHEGDIVIDDRKFWVMKAPGHICSGQAPSSQTSSGDCKHWAVLPYEGIWDLKQNQRVQTSYELVGIGFKDKNPTACLDICCEENLSQIQLLPESHQHPEMKLLQHLKGEKTTPIHLTSLIHWKSKTDGYESKWTTNAKRGFIFHNDLQRGYLHFLPGDTVDPSLCLVRPSVDENLVYAKLVVGERETSLVTDTPNGFSFYRVETISETSLPANGLLMQICQNQSSHRPQVGIGTAAPTARLDIHDGEQAQVQLLPEKDGVPAITLFQHQEGRNSICLTTEIRDRSSGWTTNAEEGFSFQTERQQGYLQVLPSHTPNPTLCLVRPSGDKNQTYTSLTVDNGGTSLVSNTQNGFGFYQGGNDCDSSTPVHELLMQIRQNRSSHRPQVGIGTAAPTARLDIHDGEQAQVQLLPEKDGNVIPAIQLSRRGGQQNFSLGAGSEHAVLTTDATQGFLFKIVDRTEDPGDPEESEAVSAPLDLNEGRTLMSISPMGNGRVGIGRSPGEYELDIQGAVQTRSVYYDTNKQNIRNHKPLHAVLSTLQSLHPMTFQWGSESTASEEQIGLLAEDVKPHFPQVVRTHDGKAQSVAYANLVPVLVKAIQELSQQYCDLENQIAQQDNLIKQQNSQIVLLAIVTVVGWLLAFFIQLF